MLIIIETYVTIPFVVIVYFPNNNMGITERRIMYQKKKIRLKSKNKVLTALFVALLFVAIIVTCSIPILAASIINESTESSNDSTISTQNTISKSEEAQKRNEGGRIEPEEHKSTMQLMILEEEVAKGDYAMKIEKAAKKARLKRQRAKEEIELLARLICGEAGGQSKECQQAVGLVVVNRKNSKYYPNTIKEVIYQKGQYECTWKKSSGFYRKPSKENYKNAEAVLSGKTVVDLPEKVLGQAMFKQGKVWRKIGTEYFCYLG